MHHGLAQKQRINGGRRNALMTLSTPGHCCAREIGG